MKKSIILSLALVAMLSTSVLATDATTSASTWEESSETAKPAVTNTVKTTTAVPVTISAPVENTEGYEEYVVKSGDTLGVIAAKYGVTYQEIAELNKLASVNSIYVGQTLLIPGTNKVEEVATETVVEEVAEEVTTEAVVEEVATEVEATTVIEVTTEVEVEEVDAVATASLKETSDPDALVALLSADGTWIAATLSDVKVEEEIVVAGTFHSKDDPEAAVYRKLALYAQDEERNVTANYTLTAPKMTVETPNFRIQNGTFVGDIYVDAEGFELSGTTVEGNVYFATQELFDTAKLEKGTIVGEAVVETVDAVASASKKEVADADELRNLLGAKGTWIAAITDDVTVKGGNLVVEGSFFDKDDINKKIYRKLALYAQDSDRNVTANYTLKADMLEVKSPNFRIQNGVVDGNIYVDAPGFELINTEVTGVIIYSTAAYYNPALISSAKYTKDIVVN